MSPTVQDKPPGKSRSRKVVSRSKKRDQTQTPKLSPEDKDQIGEAMAFATAADVVDTGEVELAATVVSAMNEAPPAGSIADPIPDTLATINDPASDRHGPNEVMSDEPMASGGPVEIINDDPAIIGQDGGHSADRSGPGLAKPAAARPIEQAMEVQAELARQACANFFEGTQIAFRLYGDFTRRMLTPWQPTVRGK